MKKITRMVLISAIFVTSGLTAKIASENYKAVITNDERIHTAHENLKKPNKAAVLEAIVDAANAESDERIQNAVVIDPDEPKVVHLKAKVRTSAGVSPIASVMDKKTVNKAEEFIEKVAHPAEVVMGDILEFSSENIPNTKVPIHELTYKTKDIFPEFEEVTEKPLTYRIVLSESPTRVNTYLGQPDNYYYFDNTESYFGNAEVYINIDCKSIVILCGYKQYWDLPTKDTDIIQYDPTSRTIDYSNLADFKDSNDPIPGSIIKTDYITLPTCKEVYNLLAGIEKGDYKQVPPDA